MPSILLPSAVSEHRRRVRTRSELRTFTDDSPIFNRLVLNVACSHVCRWNMCRIWKIFVEGLGKFPSLLSNQRIARTFTSTSKVITPSWRKYVMLLSNLGTKTAGSVFLGDQNSPSSGTCSLDWFYDTYDFSILSFRFNTSPSLWHYFL